MQYFSTQEQAQLLFSEIIKVGEATNSTDAYLDTGSESSTQALMSDMMILLRSQELKTSHHKIVIMNPILDKPESRLIFTNPNTNPETLLDVSDGQIINVYQTINPMTSMTKGDKDGE